MYCIIAVTIWMALEFSGYKWLRISIGIIACVIVFHNELQMAMYRGKGDHIIATSLKHLAMRIQKGETNEVKTALISVADRVQHVRYPSIAFMREDDQVYSDLIGWPALTNGVILRE